MGLPAAEARTIFFSANLYLDNFRALYRYSLYFTPKTVFFDYTEKVLDRLDGDRKASWPGYKKHQDCTTGNGIETNMGYPPQNKLTLTRPKVELDAGEHNIISIAHQARH